MIYLHSDISSHKNHLLELWGTWIPFLNKHTNDIHVADSSSTLINFVSIQLHIRSVFFGRPNYLHVIFLFSKCVSAMCQCNVSVQCVSATCKGCNLHECPLYNDVSVYRGMRIIRRDKLEIIVNIRVPLVAARLYQA